MNLKISTKLEKIKIGLEEKGYTIVDNNSNETCDAIICNLKKGELSNINIPSNIKDGGTIIIDSGCKSVEDIETILINRMSNSI